MLKRIGYIVTTLVVVAAPPLILTQFNVRPDVDWDALGGRLQNGDVPYELVMAVLTAIGWFAWVSVVLSIVVELIAAMREVEAPSLLLFPGTQNAGRRLVAGMLMSVNSMAPVISGGLAAVPVMMPETHHSELTEQVTNSTVETPAQPDHDAVEVGRYTVQRGDTFMSLVTQSGGEFTSWKDLRAANVGVVMPSGAAINPETITIEPGTVLAVPAGSVLDQQTPPTSGTADTPSDPAASSTTVNVGVVELDSSPIIVAATPSASEDRGADGDTRGRSRLSLRAIAPTFEPPANANANADADIDLIGIEAGVESDAVGSEDPIIGSWRVADGDNFWAISGEVLEHAMGEPPTEDQHRTYWSRVVQLNADETISGDPDLIYEGEEFDILLPAIPDADLDQLTNIPQFTAADPPATEPEPAPAPPAEAAEPSTPAVEPAETDESSAVEPEAGPVAEEAVPAASVKTGSVERTPIHPVTAQPETLVVDAVDSAEPGSLVQRFMVAGSVLAIAGVAAAGVMMRFRKKRELAMAQRAHGARLESGADTDEAVVEDAQRRLEDAGLRDRLTAALRLAQTEAGGAGAVMLAQVDADGVIEFAFDGPVPDPADTDMWEVAAETGPESCSIWTLTGHPQVPSADRSLPPLVGIGSGTYLNLMVAGTFGVGGGEPIERADHLRSVIHDLGYGIADGELLLRLGAIGEADEETVANVPASDMADVAEEAHLFMDAVDSEHDRLATTKFVELVHVGELDDTEVMVVVCSQSETVALRDAMARVEAQPGRYPVAFVILGEGATVPSARWTSYLDSTGVVLKSDALGGALPLHDPAMMGRQQAAALSAALRAAVGSGPRSLGVLTAIESANFDGVAPVVNMTETEARVEALGTTAPESLPIGLVIATDNPNTGGEDVDSEDASSQDSGDETGGGEVPEYGGWDQAQQDRLDEAEDEEVNGQDDADGGQVEMTAKNIAEALGIDADDRSLIALTAEEEVQPEVQSGCYDTADVDDILAGDGGGVLVAKYMSAAYASRLAVRQIRVELLGTVDISGVADGVVLGDYERALLTALVFAGRPMSMDEMTVLLWPDTEISPRRAREVRRNLRTAVGTAVLVDGQSRWTVEVESDLAEFERLVAHATTQSSDAAIDAYARAMELVRGAPLESETSKAWAWADANDRPRELLRQRVVDTALELAKRQREAADFDAALATARLGRKVEPHCVELVTAMVAALVAKGEVGLATQEVNAWETAFESHFSMVPPAGPRTALNAKPAESIRP